VRFPVRSAVADQAVPPGRLGYNIGADVLLLHTIQNAAALEKLLGLGRLLPNPALSDAACTDAYDWMLRQMSERLPTVGDGAVWLWARTRRRDLVANCRVARGDVLITCRIPRRRVLLSHFVDWHAALNSCFHLPTRPHESDDAYNLRWDAAYDDLRARLEAVGAPRDQISRWPADVRAGVEATWEGILDTSAYGSSATWQATTHALHAEDVVEAVRLM